MVQKLQRFCQMGGFCLLVELRREGFVINGGLPGPVQFSSLYYFNANLMLVCHLNLQCGSSSIFLLLQIQSLDTRKTRHLLFPCRVSSGPTTARSWISAFFTDRSWSALLPSTCVSSRHRRKGVTLLKLRTEFKTSFSLLGPIFSDNFLKNFKLP